MNVSATVVNIVELTLAWINLMMTNPYVPIPIVCWNKLPRRIGGS
ncbi:hypothetical protein ACNKHX_03795 [Shigella flexneri]